MELFFFLLIFKNLLLVYP